MSPESIVQIGTSIVMLAFGVGAWRARRESAEVVSAADVARITAKLASLEADVEQLGSHKVSWASFDRDQKHLLREVELQLEPIKRDVDRINRKVFNGSHG